MSTQHTPGPWIFGFGETQELGHVLAVGINTGPNCTPVCVLSPADRTTELDRANARLIAAAPELLEALQEIVDAADGAGWEQLDPSFKKARRAIAKTTGEVTNTSSESNTQRAD